MKKKENEWFGSLESIFIENRSAMPNHFLFIFISKRPHEMH